MEKQKLLQALKGKLIVSCQALEAEPLHSSVIMGRMALAAKEGGASGIRANSAEDIEEIRRQVELPVIGIIKKDYSDSEIYITPTMAEVKSLLATPAEIIAMDATGRARPGNADIREMLRAVQEAGRLAMADISTLAEGVAAEKMGFDIVSTTLSGYTPESGKLDEPDFALIRELCTAVSVPVIAEGRILNPEQLVKAMHCGAWAAVVGSIITRPQIITRHFTDALKNEANGQ